MKAEYLDRQLAEEDEEKKAAKENRELRALDDVDDDPTKPMRDVVNANEEFKVSQDVLRRLDHAYRQNEHAHTLVAQGVGVKAHVHAEVIKILEETGAMTKAESEEVRTSGLEHTEAGMARQKEIADAVRARLVADDRGERRMTLSEFDWVNRVRKVREGSEKDARPAYGPYVAHVKDEQTDAVKR